MPKMSLDENPNYKRDMSTECGSSVADYHMKIWCYMCIIQWESGLVSIITKVSLFAISSIRQKTTSYLYFFTRTSHHVNCTHICSQKFHLLEQVRPNSFIWTTMKILVSSSLIWSIQIIKTAQNICLLNFCTFSTKKKHRRTIFSQQIRKCVLYTVDLTSHLSSLSQW